MSTMKHLISALISDYAVQVAVVSAAIMYSNIETIVKIIGGIASIIYVSVKTYKELKSLKS